MEQYDVCVICALPEEANAFIEVLKTHGATLKEEFSQQQQRSYFSTNIQNNKGEALKILVTWLARMGSMEATVALERILQEFQTRFAVMTGICAGNKERCKQGDLIVAEKTFLFDSGSFVRDKDKKVEQKFDIITFQMPNDVLQSIHFFESWKEEAQQYERPASKHQQKDWLLSQLLIPETTIYDIDRKILDANAPAWNKIVDDLQNEEPPLLNTDLGLSDPKQFKRMTFRLASFPYIDPKEPECHVGAMASGNAVRKDDPFPLISQVENKILGLDMEGTAFYYTLQERKSIRSFVVKGVSDYADGDKDDSYHSYAATLSAIYAYNFIKHFVTDERMPWPEGKSPKPTTTEITKPIQQVTPSTTQITPGAQTVNINNTGKKPIKVFSSSSDSPEDKKLIDELNKHFSFMTKRSKSIESWDIHNISAGMSQTEEVEKHLREAQIIILLLTPDYIYSDFYDQETPLIEERYNSGAKVIPIILRPISEDWKDTFYGKLRALPRSGPPAVTLWKNRDEVLKNIVDDIRAVVNSLS